jgi:hypothetical protein
VKEYRSFGLGCRTMRYPGAVRIGSFSERVNR